MPVTFRKLRKMFKKDGFTQESLLKEIRHSGGSDTVVKTVLNRIYNDSDKMTFEDLEAVCHVFSYDVKKAFEIVSDEEYAAIQAEMKDKKRQKQKEVAVKRRAALPPKEKPASRKTYVFGESFEGIKPDDYVLMGKYPFEADGTEKPVRWIVKEIEDDRIMLVSQYVVDVLPHYHSSSKRTTWERSDTRVWMNDTFFPQCFSQEEQDSIIPTKNCYDENKRLFSTDKVFPLGWDEINRWWPTKQYIKHAIEDGTLKEPIPEAVPYQKRTAQFTPYAEPKIDHSRDTCMGNSKLGYVLRSTDGINPGCVVSSLPVAYESDGYGDGFFSQAKSAQAGIRPAMWVRLQ